MIDHDSIALTKEQWYERFQSTVGFWTELEVAESVGQMKPNALLNQEAR